VVFGFFINYGVTKHLAGKNIQWQLPTILQLVPAAIWGIGTLFTPESPRYLLSMGKRSQALAVLSRLRNLPEDHEYVQAEFAGMAAQIEQEMEMAAGTSTLDCIKETFCDLTNRRRFILMFLAHIFGQWSGANAITQYSPTIFGYLGIKGDDARFLATGLYAIVKFTFTILCAVVIIDFIGRRRSLMTGICMQIVTLVYVGAYLGATNGRSSSSIAADPSAEAASKVAIVSIYFHAVAWSIGWFSIPYLVSAEVFPTRIRSFNMSMLMAFHWALYFGCSRAMPSLLVATHRYGAFVFFASICALSLVFVYLCMPETAGRSLESMQYLFERPLWTIHKVAYPRAEDMKVYAALRGKDGLEDPEAKNRDASTIEVERV
jgi:sugar porter (SP) family MFS transporter